MLGCALGMPFLDLDDFPPLLPLPPFPLPPLSFRFGLFLSPFRFPFFLEYFLLFPISSLSSTSSLTGDLRCLRPRTRPGNGLETNPALLVPSIPSLVKDNKRFDVSESSTSNCCSPTTCPSPTATPSTKSAIVHLMVL